MQTWLLAVPRLLRDAVLRRDFGLLGAAWCVGVRVRAAPRRPAMAFTFAAFCYMLSLVLCAALIFFAIWRE